MAKRAKGEPSNREAQTAAYFLFGYSNKEAADKLCITPAAVKFCATGFYKNLGYTASRDKASRYKFMADYFLGRIAEEKLWLVNRYLSALIIEDAKLKEQLKPLPSGLQVAALSKGRQ